MTGSGDDGALQATLSDASYERVRAFFFAFGLNTRDAAIAGKVWTDPAGWPLPIAAGLLRGADGQIMSITDTAVRELAVAAEVLLDPETIGWVWITGDDGRAMLVRRYRSAAGIVDMGAAFWRWHVGPTNGVWAGHVVWTAKAA